MRPIAERYVKLAEVALDANKRFDDLYIECTCSEIDATCWYHLTEENQRKWRVDYIAEMMALEEL